MKIQSIPNLERTREVKVSPRPIPINGKAIVPLKKPTTVKTPWDVAVVLFLMEALFRYPASWVEFLAIFVKVKYPLLRRLVGTHLLGFVSRDTLRLRKRYCEDCLFRFTGKDGGDYCKEDNCGCGCWRGSRITYKRKLSGFKCPRNKFGYGRLGRLWHEKGR